VCRLDTPSYVRKLFRFNAHLCSLVIYSPFVLCRPRLLLGCPACLMAWVLMYCFSPSFQHRSYRRFLHDMAQGEGRPDEKCQLGSSVVHRGLGHSANMLRAIAPMAMPGCIVTPVCRTPAGAGLHPRTPALTRSGQGWG